MNLIQGQTEPAITYLQQSIALMPENANLYDVLGVVYENTKKPDKAIENIKKALEIEPENADYLSHLGRMYYNLGVETRTLADENMKDTNLSAQYEQQYKDYFNLSIPYFEKAYQFDSGNRDAVFALRNMYYSLGKNAEYEKWDKIYTGE
jgi:tetratricopeptide (TPR) repeat protein